MIRTLGKAVLHCTYRFQRSYLRSREEFPHLLNAQSLTGEGAEIGVQTGYYSEAILSAWQGKKLYSIDPWRTFREEDYIDVANVAQEEHDRLYRQTVSRLSRYGDRSTVLRMTSAKAAHEFDDGQLDFAYLDAQHSYEAVKEDIRLWAPKIRKGGVLGGHDYLDGHVKAGVFGVKSAVDEFAREQGLRLIVTHEREWRSWFVFME
jgi:hypothetical protein